MGQEGLETELLEVRSIGAPTWANGGGAQDGGIGDARGGRVRRQRRVGRWGGVETRAGRGGGAGDARGVKEKRRRRSIWRRHVRRVRLRSVFVSLSAVEECNQRCIGPEFVCGLSNYDPSETNMCNVIYSRWDLMRAKNELTK